MSEAPVRTLGKYQIRGELGKGAMGVVYRGFDPALEREVAIKVMGGATVSDPDLKRRFEVEAKASAKLQHPNIVTVYDFGYDGQGAPFMAMELLKGQDLEQRIRKNPLSLKEKLDVVGQTSRGLAQAHRNGIVHRDKPANIFITESGEAKIMDFGVARLQQSSQTQTGMLLGTADYMSPEQIHGRKVDGRSDIFSAGVILYRLLTNKKPFAGDNIQAVFFKVLNQEPPQLVFPEGHEMPELQAIVDKALSKSVEDRYGSADDLADDVEDLINLYQHVLFEDTIGAASPASDADKRSDRSARRRTSTTGRVLGTTSSGSSRTHRVGTAHSAAASATSSGTGASRSVTRVMSGAQVDTMRGTGAGVGIPIQESSVGWGKYVAIAIVVVAIVGAIYGFTKKSAQDVSPAVESIPPQSAAVDIEGQFSLAERSLEAEQFSQALNAVEAILVAEPDHPRALALKERVNQAISDMRAAPRPTPPTSVPSQPEPSRPMGPSTTERVAALAADASLAIGAGDLAGAERLIRRGRELDPESSRWRQLDTQIRRAREQRAEAQAVAERQARIDTFLGRATEHLKNRDYEAAIAAYDQALQVDPDDARLIAARETALNAMQATAEAAVDALVIRETETRFVEPGQNDAPRGFESGGGVEVQRATSAPDSPADLIVQIDPTTVQPGDSYNLRVRIHNKGNRPIGVKSIELISTFGSKTTGKGQPLTPMVQRVNPRDTSLIWDVPGTWSEEQKRGSIQAVVTLVGDAKLTKTIEWQ